jgi:hypothetical protein
LLIPVINVLFLFACDEIAGFITACCYVRLLEAAGFRLLNVCDTTANAQHIAGRWREARCKRAEALIAIEGQENFEGLQRFLITVETLNKERRLLRSIYLAQKPGTN